ncbi:tRNA-intron lyase [Malassezia caprae]|uniref:tRNA-intron lyase n=1 Tax=Malassezia caprae TaxID=1381934 RepID=A0AAF0ECW9_9BASI|nr:tRNA-intron lyase [Malassezia caprae]
MSDEGDAFKLWTQGFFGKGNLSRSEPTWVARMRAEAEARERGEMTAEQLTQKRREERKLLKIERARAAVKAGIQLPDGVTALGGEWHEESGNNAGGLWRGDEDMPSVQAGVSRIKGLKYFSDDVKKPSMEPWYEHDEFDSLVGIEHFQLTMIEAFFLAGMLGCLEFFLAS